MRAFRTPARQPGGVNLQKYRTCPRAYMVLLLLSQPPQSARTMQVTNVCGLSRPERPSSADSVMAPASTKAMKHAERRSHTKL